MIPEYFSFKLFTGLLAALGFLLLFAHFIFTILTLVFKGAPYVPTPKKRIKDILELAKVSKDTISLDLGSGDGRVVRAFARAGAKKAIGLELNPILFALSKLRLPYRNAEIKLENIWKYSLEEVDILTIFFVPSFMDELEGKILKEMKKGSKIISYRYEFNNLEKTDNIDKVYLYIV